MSSNLAGLSNLLRVNPADIVLLQEFRTSKEQLDDLLKGLDFITSVNIDEDMPTTPGTVGCANPRQFSKLLLASGLCGAPWYRIHKYINDF